MPGTSVVLDIPGESSLHAAASVGQYEVELQPPYGVSADALVYNEQGEALFGLYFNLVLNPTSPDPLNKDKGFLQNMSYHVHSSDYAASVSASSASSSYPGNWVGTLSTLAIQSGVASVPPVIKFNRETVSGTTSANPVHVAAGQPIRLTVQPDDEAAQSQPWALDQNQIIGGFGPSSDCPAPPLHPLNKVPDHCMSVLTPPELSQSNASFYWVRPGTYLVSYGYTLGDGTTGTVSATFVVDPTPQFALNVSIGDLQNFAHGIENGIYLIPPIIFGPPTPSIGNIQWAQVIKTHIYHAHYAQAGTHYTKTCNSGTGLDNGYPWGTFLNDDGITAKDSPGIFPDEPNQKFSAVDWTFHADMYLMWKPMNVVDAIFVPLGVVPWGFTATAEKTTDGNWRVTSPAPVQPAFEKNDATTPMDKLFPQWSSLVENQYIDKNGMPVGKSTLHCTP